MITGIDSPTEGRIVFHGPEGDEEVLLNDLVQDHDVGILYITHDLLQVIRDPQDDYTRTLLDAVPNPF